MLSTNSPILSHKLAEIVNKKAASWPLKVYRFNQDFALLNI